jgi:hypothetical protein
VVDLLGVLMSRLAKASVAVVASIGMAFASITAAQAAPTTLTFNEFLNSPGYQVMSSESTATATYLSSSDGVRITSTITASQGAAELTRMVLELVATQSASSATLTSYSGGVPVGQPYGWAFANGYVYEPISAVMLRPDLKNGSAALARLKKTGATTVRLTNSAAGVDATAYSPSEIMAGTNVDPLASLGSVTSGAALATISGLRFSEVSSAPNATEPTSTDYSFSATLPASGLMPEIAIDVVSTFDQNHLLNTQTMSITAGPITSVSTTTLEVLNQVTLPTIWQDNTVDWVTLQITGQRIAAEKLVAPKTAAIVAKAVSAAKKAKKALTSSYLVSAAKALKYAYTAIKNGLKLTAKYSGQSGSMCVTVVKGKAVTANC